MARFKALWIKLRCFLGYHELKVTRYFTTSKAHCIHCGRKFVAWFGGWV